MVRTFRIGSYHAAECANATANLGAGRLNDLYFLDTEAIFVSLVVR